MFRDARHHDGRAAGDGDGRNDPPAGPRLASVLSHRATGNGSHGGPEHDVAEIVNVVVKPRRRDVRRDGVRERRLLPSEMALERGGGRERDRCVSRRERQMIAAVGNATSSPSSPKAAVMTRKESPPIGTVIAMPCSTLPVTTPRRIATLFNAKVNAPSAA